MARDFPCDDPTCHSVPARVTEGPLRRRQVLGLGLLGLASWSVVGCAGWSGRDPVEVLLVGIEPLPSPSLSLRFATTLRVVNPNETALDYDGVFVELDVQGERFASGVSDAKGSVPRYGEALLTVPVTASALGVARQLFGLMAGRERASLEVAMRGKLGGGGTAVARRFASSSSLSFEGLSGTPVLR